MTSLGINDEEIKEGDRIFHKWSGFYGVVTSIYFHRKEGRTMRMTKVIFDNGQTGDYMECNLMLAKNAPVKINAEGLKRTVDLLVNAVTSPNTAVRIATGYQAAEVWDEACRK